jgi:hypothetical protein
LRLRVKSASHKRKKRRMEVKKNVSAAQALQGFMTLVRSNKLTADEHEHYAILAQVIGNELHEGLVAKQELQQLREEHAKCAQQSSGADTPSRALASERDGPNVGEGPRLMAEGT